MILQRADFLKEGIFGTLRTDDGEELYKTLEHAFPTADGRFLPIIPIGEYLCVKGLHHLSHGPVITFEVTGVLGHTGLLFHVGNCNADSKGCILLGQSILGNRLLHRSVSAFTDFMAQMEYFDSFTLVVT